MSVPDFAFDTEKLTDKPPQPDAFPMQHREAAHWITSRTFEPILSCDPLDLGSSIRPFSKSTERVLRLHDGVTTNRLLTLNCVDGNRVLFSCLYTANLIM